MINHLKNAGGGYYRAVRGMALKLPLIYASAGAVWIFASDNYLDLLAASPSWLTHAQTIKGWLYVLATSTLLYYLLRRYGKGVAKLLTELDNAREEYRQVIETIPSVVKKSRYPGLETIFISDSIAEHLGEPAAHFIADSRLWQNSIHEEDRAEVLKAIHQQLKAKGTFSVRYRMRHADGHSCRWFEEQGQLVRHTRREGPTVSSALLDVTGHVDSEQRASFLASHDPLTGLVAQHALTPALNSILSLGSKPKRLIACLCVGIEQLHRINAAYGRRAGDNILIQVGEAIQAFLLELGEGNGPGEVLLARGDGGRFLVLLPDSGELHAKRVGTQLLNHLEGLNYEVDGHAVHAGIRIGIAVHQGPLSAIDTLISRAEAALKETRALGVESVHLLDINKFQAQTESMLWLENVRGALEENRLLVHFQPIQSLSDGRIHHYEALLRMQDTDGSIVPPSRIIEVAEQFTFVNRIDKFVIKTVIDILTLLCAQSQPVSFAVNLSGVSISDLDFLDSLRRMLMESQIDRRYIVFEVTETAAIKDLGTAQHFMTSLQALGCRFALDDFGIGFTSFSHLKTLPVDFVKIDGSFIRNIETNQTDFGLVRAIADVAKLFGKQVVAEFVENAAIVEMLRSIGVDYAQGYHIGKPAPMHAADFLGSQRVNFQ